MLKARSHSRDEFLNGFERDASVRPRSFIGKATDEENHFVRGLFGIQRLTTERFALLGAPARCTDFAIRGGYSEPSSPHSRAGRSVDGTNANPAQEDVVSAGAVNWFSKLGRS